MVAMKGVMPQTTPLFLAGVRLLPAGVLVLAVALWLDKPQPQGWRAWLGITLFALVDGTLFQGFLAEGLARTGAGLGSVMIDSQPLAVALLALWIFGEQIGLWGWVGLAVGILGISLIGLPPEWILGLVQGHVGNVACEVPIAACVLSITASIFQNGQGLMLLAALSMAAGTIISRFVSRHTDPIVATGWHMILGGIPLAMLSAQTEVGQWVNLSLRDWTALSYSTIFGSAIAYGLFFYFAAKGSLTSLSSLTFLTPVFALLFGHLLLNEVLNPLQWVGVGLTLVSIYLINQREQLNARSSASSSTLPDGILDSLCNESEPNGSSISNISSVPASVEAVQVEILEP